MFCFCPLVLYFLRNKYHRSPPTGSVLTRAVRLLFLAMKGKWSMNPVQTRKNFKSERFWEDVKPSHLGAGKPGWMQFDDAWVDQVARGLRACSCFTWIPLYCESPPPTPIPRKSNGNTDNVYRAQLQSNEQQPHLASRDYATQRRPQ
jgi:hypothetical protein